MSAIAMLAAEEDQAIRIDHNLRLALRLSQQLSTNDQTRLQALVPHLHTFMADYGLIDGAKTHITGLRLADSTTIQTSTSDRTTYRHPNPLLNKLFNTPDPTPVLLDTKKIDPILQAIIDEALSQLRFFGELNLTTLGGPNIHIDHQTISQITRRLNAEGRAVVCNDLFEARRNAGYEIRLSPVANSTIEGRPPTKPDRR